MLRWSFSQAATLNNEEKKAFSYYTKKNKIQLLKNKIRSNVF